MLQNFMKNYLKRRNNNNNKKKNNFQLNMLYKKLKNVKLLKLLIFLI